MALGNYGELKAAIADWLIRDDLSVRIPEFIRMAEARFNRELRTRQMMRRATADINTHFFPLPRDWLEAINIQVDGRSVSPLEVKAPDYLDAIRSREPSGQARYYTFVNRTIELVPPPPPPVHVEMTYYGAIEPLTDAEPVNWLLAESPDLYLYASLMSAEAFLMNDDRITIWSTLMTQAMQAMQQSTNRALHSGSALIARPRSRSY